ncbi:RsmD family RNA methyltransferase, partial [Rubrivirga sp.]|uniref:RsmD family RNA methyltransferase n=1 Tax=Rubrivirga sp. TaxID=1885344 RepID=UPI003C754E0E
RCTFVERHAPTLAVARGNARSLDLEGRCSFVKADALSFLRRGPAGVDLALADPPYDLEGLASLPALVRPVLDEGGLFVLEHDARHRFEEAPGLVLTRSYGRTVVSVFEGE